MNRDGLVQILDIYRVGLITRVLNQHALVSFVDQLIVDGSEFTDDLVEISLSGSKDINITIAALDEVIGTTPPRLTGHYLFNLLYEKYQQGEISVVDLISKALNISYKTGIDNEDRLELDFIDDNIHLYEIGANGADTLVRVKKHADALFRKYSDYKINIKHTPTTE